MRQVVVTGGGTGIGRAVAAAFAEAGDEVVITGRRADVLAKTAADLGPAVRPVPFDAADPDQITAALSDLPPRVDVLVNCAGGNTDIGAPSRPAWPGWPPPGEPTWTPTSCRPSWSRPRCGPAWPPAAPSSA